MRDFVAAAKELMAQEYERFGAAQSAKSLREGDPIWSDSYVLAAISSALEKANHYAREIERLRAELARIEESGTPWVPELLEWLEKHDCCPALPFTDYELIEALEARFGTEPSEREPDDFVDRALSLADVHAEDSREDGVRLMSRGALIAFARDITAETSHAVQPVVARARYFASGPEGCFYTEDMHLAEKIVNRIDLDDDWTITDLQETKADETF